MRLKQVLKISLPVLIIILLTGFIYIRFYANTYKKSGEVRVPSLEKTVRVVRDEKGMPYIYAQNIHDAVRAQGFVTAQDRLFQLELHRLFATGKLTELAGEAALELDIRNRTIGFHRHAREHAALLNKDSREFLQAYVDGINDFIEHHPGDHHLEFSLAGLKPQKWQITDVLSVMYYLGWGSAANLQTELTMLMLHEKFDRARVNTLLPLNIHPSERTNEMSAANTLQPESQGKNAAGFNTVQLQKLAALFSAGRLEVGSNNWAIAPERSESGSTIVADDPHLANTMMPGRMYSFSFILPDNRIVGTSIPGVPGFLVGRSQYVAWGITNSYGDAQDLYIETVDPDNRANYLEGSESIPFTVIRETLRIKDSEAESGFTEKTIEIRTTARGPVISDVVPGFETDKIITLRWSPFETKRPDAAIHRLYAAESAEDLQQVIRGVTFVMLNFVFGDVEGNIGWQTSGRLPVRAQGESLNPYRVTATDNWRGFIPSDKMPHAMNPDEGWLGTANHRTVSDEYPYYYGSYFAPDFRVRRLTELMQSSEKHSAADAFAYQRDTKNLYAESLVPVFIGALKQNNKKGRFDKYINLLSEWNYREDKNSRAAAVFQPLVRELLVVVLEDEMGDDLDFFLKNVYFWQQRFEQMVLSGESIWFDDITTAEKETFADMVVKAVGRAETDLRENHDAEFGESRWGQIHRMIFVNPLMRKGPLKSLLGGGNYPMGGSHETLYRAAYSFVDPYDEQFGASLRMVADFADNEKVLAVIPNGVEGRIFGAHSRDQTDAFMNGEKLYWWFTDELLEKHHESIYHLVNGAE